MSRAVGNVTRLLTRNCYSAIEQKTSWDQLLFVSLTFVTSFPFSQSNIVSLNGSQWNLSLVLWELFILTQVTLDWVVVSFNAAGFSVRHLVRQGESNEFHFVGDLGWKKLFFYPCSISCMVSQTIRMFPGSFRLAVAVFRRLRWSGIQEFRTIGLLF